MDRLLTAPVFNAIINNGYFLGNNLIYAGLCMNDERATIFINALRQAKLRLTPQRLSICRMLANSNGHPTAMELYEQLRTDFPTLSLATVYTTLSTLLALGLIHDLGSAGDGTLHYDPDTEPHVNLICTRCHQIGDLDDETLAAVS